MSSSDSDEPSSSSPVKLFGRQRPIHAVLGGGRVADVLLWKQRNLSVAILIGFTTVWFLFEVVQYNFLTLLCHIFMSAMLIVFIWSNVAALLDRYPPTIPEIILSESAFKEFALAFRVKLNQFLTTLYDIACGKDLRLFLLAIASLWILSVIGTYFSCLNLLYIGFLCIQTLPFLYERYERDVDSLASKGYRKMTRLFKKFDSRVLNKIPRGPVKEKKFK